MVKNKRVLAIIMATMMVLSLIPNMVFADTAEEGAKVTSVAFSNTSSVKLTYAKSSISASEGLMTYTTEGGEAMATVDEIKELFDISSSNQSIIADENITIKGLSNTSTNNKRFYISVSKNDIKATGTVNITVKAKADDSIQATKTFVVVDGVMNTSFAYASTDQQITISYTLNDTVNDPNNVEWTVDNSSVAMIENVVVDDKVSTVTLKTLANGVCKITAIFGEQKATCTLNVLKDGVYANTTTGSVNAATAGEPLTELVLDGVAGTKTGYLGFYENGKKSPTWLYSDNENVLKDDGDSAGQFVSVADGTANIYFYNYNNGNLVKVLPVTVKGTGKEGEDGWSENPNETKVQTVNGGTVSLTNYSVRSNLSNKAVCENYIVGELGASAELQLTITPGGKVSNGSSYPEDIEAILEQNRESYEASVKEYIRVEDADGNSVDADVTVERIYVNGNQVSADVKVSVNNLEHHSKYSLVLKWGTPTISYNTSMNKIQTGLLKKDIAYTFNTVKKDFSKNIVTDIPDCAYTGAAITPSVEVKDGDKTLTLDTDYIVKYENNTEIGVATVTITGIGVYDGEITKTFNIVKVAPSAVTLSKTSVTLYEGKTASVKATVVPENTTDKSVTYTSSDTKIAKVDANGKITAVSAGTAKITAVANDNGTVKATCTVTVKPVFTKITATAKSSSYNSIRVTWTKDKKADGYTVYKYNATSKKYVAVKSTTARSYKATKLKTGKNYAYKVRAYRVVNGKKVYGSYTAKVTAKPVPSAMNMTVTAKKGGKTVIKWNKVAGTTKYVVYKSTKKNSGYSKVGTTKNTSYTDKGLKKGKTYYYKARAYKVVDGKKVYGSYTKVFAVKAK